MSLPTTAFSNSDIPIANGRIYHLDIRPDQLARNVILVGDPDRTANLSGRPILSYLDILDLQGRLNTENRLLCEVRCDVFHRGLRTITAKTLNGMDISFVTSGMGTPSTEIVINELDILRSLDFVARRRKQRRPLNIIRLGTSGGLLESIKLGTSIIAEYAVGLDNTALFLDIPASDEELDLESKAKALLDEKTPKGRRFEGKIQPYAARGNIEINNALSNAALKLKYPLMKGITFSNAGFFANQGRRINELDLTIPEIDEVLSKFTWNGLLSTNMEMESSILLSLMNALGHRASALSIAIANRRLDTFDTNMSESIQRASEIAISALESLQDS